MNVYIKREYDYAIRICIYLAGQKENSIIPLSTISRELLITRPFATKIVHQLKQKGIIGSVQGKMGGVFLNKNPEDTSILDVLEALNFDSTFNECLKTENFCPFSGQCKVHHFYAELENLILKNMQDRKISEFINTH